MGNTEFEYKKCVVCKKTFNIRIGNKKQPIKRNGFRSKQSVTCSDKCSRVYKRVRQHIISNKQYFQFDYIKNEKMEKLSNKLKELKKQLDNCSCSFGGQCTTCTYLEGFKEGYKYSLSKEKLLLNN